MLLDPYVETQIMSGKERAESILIGIYRPFMKEVLKTYGDTDSSLIFSL